MLSQINRLGSILPARVTRRINPTGSFRVKDAGFILGAHGHVIENRIFWRGLLSYETQAIRAWLELAARSEVIFDVGANIGLYALAAKHYFPRAKVYGFEAVRKTYEDFADNCRLNHFDIKAVHAAVGDREGRTSVHFVPGNIMAATCDPLYPHPMSEEVRMIRLDTFAMGEGIGKIDLIKIDVEGLEVQVLKGMGRLLESRPAIILEILRDSEGEQIEALTPGYHYIRLDESQGRVQVPHLSVQGVSRHSRNFLLLPK